MLTDYEPFFKLYKSKNIVYPAAVARHFGLNVKQSYMVCEDMKTKGIIKSMYMIKCPVCGSQLPTRYYSVMHIDDTNEIGCCNCDTEFIPNIEHDVFVLYEKI